MPELKKLRGKKVLVTGGAGFIGSHIIDRCAEAEEMETYSVDIKRPAYANRKACYFQMDILNTMAMEWMFSLVKPDYVIHCAAMARIQPSFERPDDYFKTNVLGTRVILEMSKKFDVKRVIFSSSSSVYGFQESLPFTENLKDNPLNPYAHTKLMSENLCQFMGEMTGGPETVCLRYFNVFGPRQPSKANDPYATVIGIFFDQYGRGEPMTVVPDGFQRRDFTHVYDVAEVNVLAMISPKVGQGEIINIGFGKNYSVFDVCAKIFDCQPEELVEGKDFRFIASRRGEALATLANISKARDLLGWQPKIPFSKGIEMLKNQK
ncbi:MAG: NAD-dependent epimerase/dehydratase family protein [Patescibacteria group bacterium]